MVALAILLVLVFSKNVYLASISSYYTFYLIEKFGVSVQSAQLHLFVFLGAVAAGTIIGGPVGDRLGRKWVIWASILGVLPFTLALPYVNLFWTGVLSVAIGVILASAFSAILVFAQELVPGRIGMVSGLFFGFAFGTAGIGAALLGDLADRDRHRVRLPALLLPAGAGAPHRVSAAHRERRAAAAGAAGDGCGDGAAGLVIRGAGSRRSGPRASRSDPAAKAADRVTFHPCGSRRIGGRPAACARRSNHVQHASLP